VPRTFSKRPEDGLVTFAVLPLNEIVTGARVKLVKPKLPVAGVN
jgi:hypothetical protein